MERAVHTFDNGVRVYDDHLLDEQRERYRKHNVHESEEENIFVNLIQRIPANGCFLDVGAAIGYYLILARKLAPGITIHAVEPLARHRAFMRENMREKPPPSQSEYLTQILNARVDPNVSPYATVSIFQTKQDRVTVLWVDGLKSLPPEYATK